MFPPNNIVPTRPLGTSDNSAASTQFVNQALTQAWTSYTVNFTATGGSAGAANITTQGAFLLVGKTVFFRVSIVMTDIGSWSGYPVLNLPVLPVVVTGLALASGREYALTGLSQVAFQNAVQGSITVSRYDNGSALGNGNAFTLTGLYEAA